MSNIAFEAFIFNITTLWDTPEACHSDTSSNIVVYCNIGQGALTIVERTDCIATFSVNVRPICFDGVSFNNLDKNVIVDNDVLRIVDGQTNWSEVIHHVVWEFNVLRSLNVNCESKTVMNSTVGNSRLTTNRGFPANGSIIRILLRAIMDLYMIHVCWSLIENYFTISESHSITG